MATQHRNERLMKAIGKRLRELREARGISQERVAFQTGTYLPRIEKGLRNISVSTLVKICRTYKISVLEFFKGLDYDQTGS